MKLTIAVSIFSIASAQIVEGIEGSITNSRQVLDTLSRQLTTQNTPTRDVLNAFITGADSQIDNLVGTVSAALSPLTFGLSEVVGNFLLGPFVQSLTNGGEVLLSNLVAMPVDMVLGPLLNLVNNMDNVQTLAKKSNVDVKKLHETTAKLNEVIFKEARKSCAYVKRLDKVAANKLTIKEIVQHCKR